MSRIRAKFFPSLLSNLLITISYLFAFPTLVSAQAKQIQEPEGYADISQLQVVFNNVVSVVAVIGGFLAFIALIAGGFRYITARGDPKAITAAQGMITWAIIGLVLIIISYLAIRFLGSFFGINTTQVCIPPEACP